MRILVVTQYFWPENFRINDLVAELVNRGHTVNVLTGKPNYPEGFFFENYIENPLNYRKYQGAEVTRVPMFARGQGALQLVLNYLSFAISASVFGFWKLRNHNFDVIFAYEPSPITVGIPALVFRKLKNAPLTLWVLDLWPETLEAVGVVKSKFLLKMIGVLVSFIYKHCDLILAQSKSFMSSIEHYAPNGSLIRYFPSWAESVFEGNQTQPKATLPSNFGTFNILFAGNIGEAQDFPAIISAAELLKKHSHIRWIIIGEGRQADWVSQEIKQRSLSETVLMMGKYPLEYMPSFFKQADALLVSLKNEPIFSMTIPGKLQAYLVSGVPILAMLNGEGSQVVLESKAGFVCPAGDYHALADAVLKLSSLSREQRLLMGESGLVFSAREFSREKLMNQLELLLVESSNMKRIR